MFTLSFTFFFFRPSLTLYHVGRGDQKNYSNVFKTFQAKIFISLGQMVNVLVCQMKGPWFKSQWENMIHFTSLALFDAQRRKKIVLLLLEWIQKVKTCITCNSGGKNEKKNPDGMALESEPGTLGIESQNSTLRPHRWLTLKRCQKKSCSCEKILTPQPPTSDQSKSIMVNFFSDFKFIIKNSKRKYNLSSYYKNQNC